MVTLSVTVTVQKPSSFLKPGDVGVKIRNKFDPWASQITLLEGDTKACHVWLVLPNGKIATTGADFGVMYGEVDPDEYLKGQSFYLLRALDPLSSHQLLIIQKAHEALLASGAGRFYGFWNFGVIWYQDLLQGQAPFTGKAPRTGRPFCPICSQAVAYVLWAAGVRVGSATGKEDWTAVIPETILDEGIYTYNAKQRGLVSSGRDFTLCLVQKEPFCIG